MTNVLVVGYGNVGKKVVLNESDLNLVAIQEVFEVEAIGINVPIVKSMDQVKEKIDVAILSIPSLCMPAVEAEILAKGINTVDSFDIHSKVSSTQQKLGKIAKANNCVSIMSAGWDPGSDSVVRALMEAMVPKGITYTNLGPGMSMGHTVVVREIEGVEDALSLTIPVGAGVHRRMVYVQLKQDTDFLKVAEAVKNHLYFISDETHVIEVANINDIKSSSHSVGIQRIGMSSDVNNQRIGLKMTMDNPALTAQIMVACARATMRQEPGCYTMIEIPPVDYLPGDKAEWIEKWV